jgi:hypothetical protein
MAANPVYGGSQTQFGGAMHADGGIPIVFLGPADLGAKTDNDGNITTAGTQDYEAMGRSAASALALDAADKISKAVKAAQTAGINGLILQQIDLQANRPVTTFYDLQGGNVYYVAGKSTVTTGVQRIVGPNGVITAFYKTFGRVCNAKYNVLAMDMSKAACTSGGVAATQVNNNMAVFNCLLMQLSISVSAQNFIITESAQIQGSELCYVS